MKTENNSPDFKWRPTILGLLVAIYVLVSLLAYTDYPRSETGPALTEIEYQGLAVWRQYNCQACHQVHGFGGFLGPDLTNRVDDSRYDEEFEAILTDGSGQMPALALSLGEQEAVLSYLRAVDRTGRAQPEPLKASKEVDQSEHLALLTQEYVRITGHPLADTVQRGSALWSDFQCGFCHVPFTESPNGAVDLSAHSVDRSLPGLEALLAEGKRNMPSYDVTPTEVEELSAYLEWIATQRGHLIPVNDRLVGREKFSWGVVPWFEYQ